MRVWWTVGKKILKMARSTERLLVRMQTMLTIIVVSTMVAYVTTTISLYAHVNRNEIHIQLQNNTQNLQSSQILALQDEVMELMLTSQSFNISFIVNGTCELCDNFFCPSSVPGSMVPVSVYNYALGSSNIGFRVLVIEPFGPIVLSYPEFSFSFCSSAINTILLESSGQSKSFTPMQLSSFSLTLEFYDPPGYFFGPNNLATRFVFISRELSNYNNEPLSVLNPIKIPLGNFHLTSK